MKAWLQDQVVFVFPKCLLEAEMMDSGTPEETGNFTLLHLLWEVGETEMKAKQAWMLAEHSLYWETSGIFWNAWKSPVKNESDHVTLRELQQRLFTS